MPAATRLQISLDPGVPGPAAVEVVIQAAQLATGVAAVDPVLVGPDILDAAAHPQIVFQAGELRMTASRRLRTARHPVDQGHREAGGAGIHSG